MAANRGLVGNCADCGHAGGLHYGPEGVCVADCRSLTPLVQCCCKEFVAQLTPKETLDDPDRTNNVDVDRGGPDTYGAVSVPQALTPDAALLELPAQELVSVVPYGVRDEWACDLIIALQTALRASLDREREMQEQLEVERRDHRLTAQRQRADEKIIERLQPAVEQAERDRDTLAAAAKADDQRLREASDRAGILYVGCDTPDALAERVLALAAELQRLKEGKT